MSDMNILNLSKEESMELLNLRKNTLDILCLEKQEVISQPARVALVIDASGSMQSLYMNGTVQAVMEKLFPIALKLDDNGEMEFWCFSDEFQKFPNVTMENYYGYINKYVYGHVDMGGTNYAPVMHDVVDTYMFKDRCNLPSLILFITDGENWDAGAATIQITASSYVPIFWQFIGISDGGHSASNFRFLKKLDEMDGRYVDNANFFQLNDLLEISDNDLYQRLLAEYPQWLEYSEVKYMMQYPEQAAQKYLKATGNGDILRDSDRPKNRLLRFFKTLFKIIMDII